MPPLYQNLQENNSAKGVIRWGNCCNDMGQFNAESSPCMELNELNITQMNGATDGSFSQGYLVTNKEYPHKIFNKQMEIIEGRKDQSKGPGSIYNSCMNLPTLKQSAALNLFPYNELIGKTNRDISTIGIKYKSSPGGWDEENIDTGYIYTPNWQTQFMKPTMPGGWCYGVKETNKDGRETFNYNTCHGGDPNYLKVRKCKPLEPGLSNSASPYDKRRSIIGLNDYSDSDVKKIRDYFDTAPNYKLGICPLYKEKHWNDRTTYLTDGTRVKTNENGTNPVGDDDDDDKLYDDSMSTFNGGQGIDSVVMNHWSSPDKKPIFDNIGELKNKGQWSSKIGDPNSNNWSKVPSGDISWKDGDNFAHVDTTTTYGNDYDITEFKYNESKSWPSNSMKQIGTLFNQPYLLDLPEQKDREFKFNVTRDANDKFEGIVYATLWFPQGCDYFKDRTNKQKGKPFSSPPSQSLDKDCPMCKYCQGEDELNYDGTKLDNFDKRITNISFQKGQTRDIIVPQEYITYSTANKEETIKSDGGRLVFHALPIEQKNKEYFFNMDPFDQIEFTIQYRDVRKAASPGELTDEQKRFVLPTRIVANLSAVDYLKNFKFDVKFKDGEEVINQIKCDPWKGQASPGNLDEMCINFYSRNNPSSKVIKPIIENISKYYDNTSTGLRNNDPINIIEENGEKYSFPSPGYFTEQVDQWGSWADPDGQDVREKYNKYDNKNSTIRYNRIAQQCPGPKHTSDFVKIKDFCGIGLDKYNNPREGFKDLKSEQSLKGLTCSSPPCDDYECVTKVLDDFGYNQKVRDYYNYMLASPNADDLYAKYGPASNVILTGIYGASNSELIYDSTVSGDGLITVPASTKPEYKYYYPDEEILGEELFSRIEKTKGVEKYVKAVTKNYRDLDPSKAGRESQSNVISPYINGILQRGWGTITHVYSPVIDSIDGGLKWIEGLRGGFCKGVVSNEMSNISNRKNEFSGASDPNSGYFYNDWIDFVTGKDIYREKAPTSPLPNDWGDGCQQYPISYGDACDPPSTSVVTTYTSGVDMNFGVL